MTNQDIEIVTKIFMDAYYLPPWEEKWEYGRAFQRVKDVFNAPNGLCIVCEESGQIIGALLCLIVSWTSGVQLEVRDIFVQPELHNRSVGSFLLQMVTNYVDEEKIEIVLSTKNEGKLTHFYSKNGFGKDEDIVFFTKECINGKIR